MDRFPRTISRKRKRSTGAAASPAAALLPRGRKANITLAAAVDEDAAPAEVATGVNSPVAAAFLPWGRRAKRTLAVRVGALPAEVSTGANSPEKWEAAVQQLKVGDMVTCRWRDGRFHAAKILQIRQDPSAGDGEEYEYYVHYSECESILLRLRRQFNFLFSGSPFLCSWLESWSELITWGNDENFVFLKMPSVSHAMVTSVFVAALMYSIFI